MTNYFKENGELSETGVVFLTNFRSGIEMLFDTDELQEFTESELRMLETNMLAFLCNKFTNRIATKTVKENQFSKMSDAEFEEYLKLKYGKDMWQFSGLTEEELKRVTVPTEEEIRKAVDEGTKDYRIAYGNYIVPIIPKGYFKG